MERFNVVVPVEVTFRDTDAMGHANNAVYLTWFENARMEYWRRLAGGEADYRDVPFVLGRAEVDYRAPVHAGDRLRLGARAARLGERSFDLVYRLERERDGGLMAEGRTVQVMYDYRQERSMEMSEGFRDRLLALDGAFLE